MTEPLLAAPLVAVAKVAVDMPLAHLDRPFDYRIPAELADDAVPGARVVVRFSGQLRDGFILDVTDTTEHDGSLAGLDKVVSAESVLTASVARLIRAVADHYAGTFADVMRLAIPPRHAATEQADVAPRPPLPPWSPDDVGCFHDYPTGPELLRALADGVSPRAYWQVMPTAAPAGDWCVGLAAAAAATAASGRGVVVVVPDARDLARLSAACVDRLGATGFVELTADMGPAARYRSFLAAARGDVSVVIGTRSAAFAPVSDVGLVAIWDDGDDAHAEPRAPYPHARDVLAIRAAQSECAFLAAGYARSCEIQQFVERRWLRTVEQPPAVTRSTAPVVRVASATDRALEADAAAHTARMPHDVFLATRAGLACGPVLVQVPRAGHRMALVCDDCRDPLRCAECGAGLRAQRTSTLECRQCGQLVANWACTTCGGHRWRAPVVGAERTAEELGRAFPMTVIARSSGDHIIDAVDGDADLVVATPGAEPHAAGAYAAAIMLDAEQLLWRADLRADEEALRRWLNAVALVRPPDEEGAAVIVGPPDARPVQALVRLDPAGFAARELADRHSAQMVPAAVVVAVTGTLTAVTEFSEHFTKQAHDVPYELLGPVDLDTAEPRRHLLLRCALNERRGLVAAVKTAVATRSAHKEGGGLKVVVDPAHLE